MPRSAQFKLMNSLFEITFAHPLNSAPLNLASHNPAGHPERSFGSKLIQPTFEDHAQPVVGLKCAASVEGVETVSAYANTKIAIKRKETRTEV